MRRAQTKGFSVVELMVAVVIGLIGSIIIFQVYASFEGQKRTTTSGGDTQTNIAIATNALEQAGRHAGYGLNFKSHLGCDAVVWRQHANTTLVPPDPGTLSVLRLVPVNIVRDAPGGNLTSLTFVGGNNDSVYSVTQLVTGMADTETDLKPANMYGFDQGDVLVLAEKKDTTDPLRKDKITCAITDIRHFEAPVAPETKASLIDHTFGSFSRPATPTLTEYSRYNKAGGLGSLTAAQLATIAPVLDLPFPDGAATRFKFSIGASVMNSGRNTGGNFGMRSSEFTLSNGQLLENGRPLVDGIVFMEAQYGKAATPTANAVSYIKDMPETAGRDPKISQADWFSLRTVRVVLIARVGQYEKEVVSPASYTIWGSPDPHGVPVTYNVPATDRHYRHKVVEMVIPLRNMFWRPQ